MRVRARTLHDDEAEAMTRHFDGSREEGACNRNARLGVSLCTLTFVLFFLLMAVAVAFGQAVQDSPDFSSKINVVEHLGDTIPLDLPFVNTQGDTVPLGSFFKGDIPVILLLHYSDCPMLCSLVLNGTSKVIRQVDLTPGVDFRVVAASINPRETVQRAAQTEQRYRKELPKGALPETWSFLVGPQSSIDSLANALGFQYFYDKKHDQFAHPAVMHILSPDGHISRYLYGVDYNPRDVRLGLLEASEGKVGTTVDKIVLYCFHYDPDAEGYVVVAANVMRIGGAVTLVLLGVLLGLLWARDRKKHKQEAQE